MKDATDSQELERRPEPQAPEAVESGPGSAVVSFAAEQRVTFAGPLPPPLVLGQYEEICPGAADRIISMAEHQSAHRQKLESAVVASNCEGQRRGPLFGFALASMVILIGGLLLWNGRDVAGLTALITALASIVVPFVLSKHRQRAELEKRRFRDPDHPRPEVGPAAEATPSP